MTTTKKAFQILPFSISILSGFLIMWFLSGKIIDIPRGTPEGGLAGAIGVFIIIALSFVLMYLSSRVTKTR
jgi:hydrogenase-4 membrane subunit HyfE